MPTAEPPDVVLDDVEVGGIAQGGHCVARHEGRVIFVRHALPGEIVRVRITDASKDRFWRGDAIEILQASPDRVDPVCPIAVAGGCGGCDFQHASAEAQRALKTEVVRDLMKRIGNFEWSGSVEDCGLPFGWRTRMRYVRIDEDTLGMRAWRSRDLIALPPQGCALAHPRTVTDLGGMGAVGDEVAVIGASSGPTVIAGDEIVGPDPVTEHALGRDWQVAARGFWQVHPAAPMTLIEAVVQGLQPRPGDRAWDLYCGVGLFAGALEKAGCVVAGIEGQQSAVALARENVADGRFWAGSVERRLRNLPQAVNVVVLDPPRVGVGEHLMRRIVDAGPRAIAYVSCDPATLARDLRAAIDAGARLSWLRAFDLFPQTHHVEAVAILELGRS